MVLTVPNKHIAQCGKPPGLIAGKLYTAYFENCYGEQLVFQYDREKHKGMLWGGDWGWENPVEVFEGGVISLVMGVEEGTWLHVVWDVATAGEPEEVKRKSALNRLQGIVAEIDDALTKPEYQSPTIREALTKIRNAFRTSRNIL